MLTQTLDRSCNVSEAAAQRCWSWPRITRGLCKGEPGRKLMATRPHQSVSSATYRHTPPHLCGGEQRGRETKGLSRGSPWISQMASLAGMRPHLSLPAASVSLGQSFYRFLSWSGTHPRGQILSFRFTFEKAVALLSLIVAYQYILNILRDLLHRT